MRGTAKLNESFPLQSLGHKTKASLCWMWANTLFDSCPLANVFQRLIRYDLSVHWEYSGAWCQYPGQRWCAAASEGSTVCTEHIQWQQPLTVQAWWQQGQQSKCQLAMTLVVSSETSDKRTDVLCVSRWLQQHSPCRPAMVMERRAAWCEVVVRSIMWPLSFWSTQALYTPSVHAHTHTHASFLCFSALGFQDEDKLY